MLSRAFPRSAPRVASLLRYSSAIASRDVGALVAAAPETVTRVGPQESAQEAAKKLLESDLGALVVVEDERVRGIVSDADFTKLIGLGGGEDRTVADIMTRDVSLLSSCGYERLPLTQHSRNSFPLEHRTDHIMSAECASGRGQASPRGARDSTPPGDQG